MFPQPTTPAEDRPIIIGLFGLPGSGKSTLKKQIEDEHVFQSVFACFEGSEVIDTIVPGGILAFKKLDEADRACWREQAIGEILRQCVDSNKVGIVTGHYMFWKEGENAPQAVLTPEDWRIFTHIMYLELPRNRIQFQISRDSARTDRGSPSKTHLEAWQNTETQELESHCVKNGVEFIVIKEDPQDILNRSLEHLNRIHAEIKLDAIINSNPSATHTVLLLDGDKTLIPDDTGETFWRLCDNSNPLKPIFDQGYSYRSFREATVQYNRPRKDIFENIRNTIAKEVFIYPAFKALLKKVANHEQISVIVATCGLGEIWKKILEANGVSNKVKVMGSETNGIIITPDLKGVLVDRLHEVHHKLVWAFGDSPMDLPMLSKADQAIVIVGEEHTRSRSMQSKLAVEIETGLRARQALMGSDIAPLQNTDLLPVVWLQDPAFVQSIIKAPQRLPRRDATNKESAKLLMSATRNADSKGPTLVDAHRLMGRYLATEYLGGVLGLKAYKMKHVQGGEIDGYRLSAEDNTVIVPLMRGGEPMARGVWEMFPTAMYVHAKYPSELHKADHIRGRAAIVLVDGVVNTGKSIVDFVKHIRQCDVDVKIVVIAGVVQKQAVEGGGVLERLSNCYGGLSLIALRISENKYTGKGATDTGHRLFNTTHMD